MNRLLEALAGGVARPRQRFVVAEQRMLLVQEPERGVQIREVVKRPPDPGDDLALLGLVEAELGVGFRERDPAAKITGAEPGQGLGQGDAAGLGADARFHAAKRLADIQRGVRQCGDLRDALPCGLVPRSGSEQGWVLLDGAVQAASQVRFGGVEVGRRFGLNSPGGCQTRRQHGSHREGSGKKHSGCGYRQEKARQIGPFGTEF